MRPIWKGTISFGLVTIPVGLYVATSDRHPRFHQLRRSDHSPIRYVRVAVADGKEVPYEEIVKGYEVEPGTFVVFTPEEVEAIMAQITGGVVDVVQFVPDEEISPVAHRSSYYLAPEPAGVKAYRLLRETLAAERKIGIARAVIRKRQYLSALRAVGDVLVLETLWWPDEIREPDFPTLAEDVDLRDEEREMARMVVDNLAGHFDPAAWHDTTREAVEAAARRKLEGHEVAVPPPAPVAEVVDLTEALRRSVERTKHRAAGNEP